MTSAQFTLTRTYHSHRVGVLLVFTATVGLDTVRLAGKRPRVMGGGASFPSCFDLFVHTTSLAASPVLTTSSICLQSALVSSSSRSLFDWRLFDLVDSKKLGSRWRPEKPSASGNSFDLSTFFFIEVVLPSVLDFVLRLSLASNSPSLFLSRSAFCKSDTTVFMVGRHVLSTEQHFLINLSNFFPRGQSKPLLLLLSWAHRGTHISVSVFMFNCVYAVNIVIGVSNSQILITCGQCFCHDLL